MDANGELEALQREFLDWFMERNPYFATHLGFHERDTEVPSGTREAKLEELEGVERFRKRAEAIDPAALGRTARVDRGVFLHTCRLWSFEEGVLRVWESHPRAPEAVGGGLFGLFMRDFAPLPQRLDSIAARMGKFPRLVEELRSRTVRPVRRWVAIAIESCERTPSFLQVITAAGKEAAYSGQPALEEAAARTAETLASYRQWLEADVMPKAEDVTGVGEEPFRRLMELRELPISVEETYELGWWYLHESKRQLAAIAARIRPGATLAEVRDLVKGDHPKTSEEAREYTAKAMGEAREFLRAKDLCTFPPSEELKVIETPSFIRHLIPFAAYSNPGKFEKVQQGIYMVTPAGTPEMLREHNYAGTMNTAVHEAYPGHHLQLACANTHPSVIRTLAGATETVEGWAHYCEDMMRREGFYADPKVEFVQVLDQMWRACRIIIDVDLHRRKMSFDEAVALLRRETGMEEPGAVAEVKRYTLHPGYQLSYLIGKHLILELREAVRAREGAAFREKAFNDKVLYAGSLPYRYLREDVLGA